MVIACRVLEPEIETLQPQQHGVEVRYIEQGLHDTPDQMPAVIQEQIDQVQAYASQIVLGYGLCSNGVVGLSAPRQVLIVPKAHDCIALFLGSHQAYREIFSTHPGTYYLTPGWVAEKQDPLGFMETKYEPRYGRAMAEEALREEYRNYTHIALIDTRVGDTAALRARARENARFLDLQYKEVNGTLAYLQRIVCGPYYDTLFFFFPPGEKVVAEPFLLMQ